MVKIGIEGSLAGVLGVLLTIPVFLLVTRTQFTIPLQDTGPVALWITVSAIIFTNAWCLLTRKRTMDPTG